MENNEIMNIVENSENGLAEGSTKAGLSTAAAIGIGAGLTLVGVATVKLVKGVVAYFKAKKAQEELVQVEDTDDL